MGEEEHEEDKKLLIEMLQNVEDDLSFVVFKKKDLLDPQFRQFFPGPWSDIRARLQRSREMVERDEVEWKYIEGVGLTGESLRFKKNIFDQARKGGLWSRIFDLMNSFLGSLASAIKILEPVKEYKDNVRAAMSPEEQ